MSNEADQDSGGIACLDSCVVELEDGVLVENCVAGGNGGGIFLRTRSILRKERKGLLLGNEADQNDAGIICWDFCWIDMKDRMAVENCLAGKFGGGIYLYLESSLRAELNVSSWATRQLNMVVELPAGFPVKLSQRMGWRWKTALQGTAVAESSYAQRAHCWQNGMYLLWAIRPVEVEGFTAANPA